MVHRDSQVIWTLIAPSVDAVNRTLEALKEFGFPASNVPAEYLLVQHKILQLGRIPVQVHLMTEISGVPWGVAWESRQRGNYGGVPAHFIGREALLANKRAAGRAKDLADIEALGGKRKPGEFGPRRVEKEQQWQISNYSDGAWKLATKALRLSGLLHCSPRPCPLKVLAVAKAGIACSTLVKGRYQTSSLRQI